MSHNLCAHGFATSLSQNVRCSPGLTIDNRQRAERNEGGENTPPSAHLPNMRGFETDAVSGTKTPTHRLRRIHRFHALYSVVEKSSLIPSAAPHSMNKRILLFLGEVN